MNPRPMYAFLAGLFLMFIGYSLLQGADMTKSYLGMGILLVGTILLIGSLIVQLRKGRDS